MKNILISACLLGTACRYDGKSKPLKEALDLAEKYHLIPVCAEILGGLPTPRIPCEIVGDKVLNRNGEDKTEKYVKGANEVLKLAQIFGCDTAVLKERSPSCGSGEIYDGSFAGKLCQGDGICAALLKKHGIKVLGETQITELLKEA